MKSFNCVDKPPDAVVWPDANTAFPDFTQTGTRNWWTAEITRFHKSVAFDGIWIDMNEPSVFGTNEKNPWYFNDPTHANTTPLACPKDQFEMPPYKTYGIMHWEKYDVRKAHFVSPIHSLTLHRKTDTS